MGNNLIEQCGDCKTLNQNSQVIGEQWQFNTIKDYRYDRISYEPIPTQLILFKPQYQHYIINLRNDNDQFNDMCFPLNSATVGMSNFQPVRISSIPSIHTIYDTYPTYISNPSNNIKPALKLISKYSQIVSRIIPNETVMKQGLLIVYLCLNGDSRNRLEVVVDDMIPIRNHQYIFSESSIAVWMILLEKAFAKILSSYSKINAMQPWEYLEDMTGIPIINIDAFNSWYNQSYYLDSYNNDLQGQTSLYYKFTLETKTKIHLSLWQPRNAYFDHPITYLKIVGELAYKGAEGYERCMMMDKVSNNKTILSDTMVELNEGEYFIHFYPFYAPSITSRVNIVMYSSHKVILRLRDEHFMKKFKDEMVSHIFKSALRTKKISLVKQEKNISVRFLWDNYRGILYIKNLYNTTKQFRVEILPNKIGMIFFENHQHDSAMVVELSQHKSALIMFFRRGNSDIGHFYTITPL